MARRTVKKKLSKKELIQARELRRKHNLTQKLSKEEEARAQKIRAQEREAEKEKGWERIQATHELRENYNLSLELSKQVVLGHMTLKAAKKEQTRQMELRQKRKRAAFTVSPNLEDDDEKDSDQEKELEDINELDSTDTSTDFLEPTVSPNDDQVTLDDLVTQESLSEKIQELNTKMAQMKPQKIRTIISLTIRKDTKMVKALKKLHNYRCQFPDCTALIPMDDGRFYVEVAHISPVAQGGQSILGNLLVLCPNHHKEFDHGELTIIEQSRTLLHGVLNGKEFAIQQLDYQV